MRVTFNPSKRARALAERGLDFARAGEVFNGPRVTEQDVRKDYGEYRYITFGYLDNREVVVVWTSRGRARRIISMRKANEREIKKNFRGMG